MQPRLRVKQQKTGKPEGCIAAALLPCKPLLLLAIMARIHVADHDPGTFCWVVLH